MAITKRINYKYIWRDNDWLLIKEDKSFIRVPESELERDVQSRTKACGCTKNCHDYQK